MLVVFNIIFFTRFVILTYSKSTSYIYFKFDLNSVVLETTACYFHLRKLDKSEKHVNLS